MESYQGVTEDIKAMKTTGYVSLQSPRISISCHRV